MDKHLKIMTMMAIAIITFSLFYYFVIFLPAEKKAIREQQAQALVEEKKKQEAENLQKEAQADAEKSQREQLEMEKIRLQESMLIKKQTADNQRRQALAECLDRTNTSLPEMSNYEAERFLPLLLEQKKRAEEKCFRFYGEK
jgi:hypothetical protein